MYIPNNDKQSYPFCRLQLAVETLKLNSINKAPNLYQPIRKRYHKTLGTYNKQPNVTSLPGFIAVRTDLTFAVMRLIVLCKINKSCSNNNA